MSTSRLEKFIYAICSMEVSDLPAPLSRIEILWNCLITGETPDFEPQSRNEQYLMAMLGLYELDQLPTPLSRGEKLLYKIAMGETDLSDIPAYLSRYEELLGYLAENGGVGDFEYILQTLNQRLSTLYSTKERPMKQAVIKGDTLVNELPRPSLKNTMANVASQKLNNGYDNGKTLVNLSTQKSGRFNGTRFLRITLNQSLKANTDYLVKFNIEESTLTDRIICRFKKSSNSSTIGYLTSQGIITTNGEGYDIVEFFINNTDDITNGLDAVIDDIMLIEYQDGMENWDIPYFEGTKTFSATPNVVDGEFKQAVVKGQTILWDNVCNEEVSNSDSPLDIWVGYGTINQSTGVMEESTVDFPTYFLEIPSNLAYIKGTATWKKIFYYNAEKEYISCQITGADTSDLRVIIPDNAVYMRLQYYKPENDLTFYLTDSDGNEIKIVRNISMKSVQLSEVKTTGKNLFDKEIVVNGIFMSGSLTITPNNTNLTLGKDNAIKVEPNTSYTFSFSTGWRVGVLGLNATKTAYTIDTKWQTNSNGYTFATDANTNYVTFNISKTDSSIIQPSDKDNLQLMLEKGSIATPYEPYQSNTLTLAEPVTLRKVGDVEDEFDALTGQVTERVGEVVLDGSERWSESGYVSTNHYCAYAKLSKSKNIMSLDVICDSLPTKDILSSSKDYEGCAINSTISSDSGNFVIKIAKSKLSSLTANGLREYLSNNPMTLQYQLATPTTKQVSPTITDQDGATQTKLHSFNDGYLSVSSQGLLPSAVNYEVPTNNSYYLPDMLTLGAQYTSRGSADCHATIDGKLLALGKNGTFTTPSSVTDKLMVLDAPVDDLMFIKGDQTAKDFGYFEGMKSVVLSNKMPVLTTVSGFNLLNPNAEPIPYEGNDVLHPDYFKAKFGDSFSITTKDSSALWCSLFCYDSDKNLIKLYYQNNAHLPRTITLNDDSLRDVAYVRFECAKWGRFENIMLNYGEQMPFAEYSGEYKSNILTVNQDVELRGIGDVQDELNCLTGEVTERVGEVVLDGVNFKFMAVNPNSDAYHDESVRFDVQDLNDMFTESFFNWTDASRYIINDRLKTGLFDVFANKKEKDFISLWAKRMVVVFSDMKIMTVEQANDWLKQNPITVQYRLETESTKTIDSTTVDQDGQPTKLKTFNDISHVEINADNLIPSVDIEVATKISETLAMLNPQQLDISNTQNELGQTIEEQAENTDAAMIATTEIYEQTL